MPRVPIPPTTERPVAPLDVEPEEVELGPLEVLPLPVEPLPGEPVVEELPLPVVLVGDALVAPDAADVDVVGSHCGLVGSLVQSTPAGVLPHPAVIQTPTMSKSLFTSSLSRFPARDLVRGAPPFPREKKVLRTPCGESIMEIHSSGPDAPATHRSDADKTSSPSKQQWGIRMKALSAEDRRSVQSIARDLEHVENPSAFGPSVIGEELRNLLRSPFFMGYTLRPDGECALQLDRRAMFSARGSGHAQKLDQMFVEFLGKQRRPDWTLFNPLRPQARQRNRAVARSWLRFQASPVPVIAQLTRMGLSMDECRVTVCDGASMLAWVGVFREEPFRRRERSILQALTPHLRKRLLLERELAGASSATLLSAVLDALGSPAFVLAPNGTIAYANDLGLELWSREPRMLAEQLRDARCHSEFPSPFELTPLRYPGIEGHQLAIRRRPTNDIAAHVDAAAARWTLTARQREVLGLVARGLTNKTIAAELGVAEVTIEVHVSALLEKAQVESRSALVAKLITTSGPR